MAAPALAPTLVGAGSGMGNGGRKPTGGGGRTHTPLRETDFESVASASSATPAKVSCIIVYWAGV